MRPAAPRLLPCLALLLALAAVASPAVAGRYLVEHAGQTGQLETIEVGGEDLVDLEAVAVLFRFQLDRDSRRELVLRSSDGEIEVRAGRALVLVNEQPVLLRSEVRRRGRRIHAPIDFVTRAVARLLGSEARLDEAARVIRFDARSEIVACERFADRTRVTVSLQQPAEFQEVVRDGRRRILVLTNQELPGQVGGCLFDETLADLEVRPLAGQTRLTFFVGPRFASLKVYDLPDTRQLVFDFFNDASDAELQPVDARAARPADVFDTVVIDPGHGGGDEGAVGSAGLKEKDLVLALALDLARLLRQQAGLQVVLTRETDDARSLTERTATANQAQADLFLSLHANATVVPNAWGAETYFLSLEATDEGARTVAALENDATGLRQAGAGGGDLEILLWDLAQQQYLQESSALASVVQRELNELAGTRDRGVRQANFVVLRGATMPAVLVEVGFLTNPREERKMATAEFRQATAEAIYRAILAFRDQRRARAGR